MNQQYDEMLVALLEKQATYGLTEEEQKQLDALEGKDDLSFEITASAINLAEMGQVEEMPAGLRAKLVADANEFFADYVLPAEPSQVIETGVRHSSLLSWLGWAFAAAAIIALAANIWLTRFNPPLIGGIPPTPTPSPEHLTPEQMRERLLASATDLAQADIGP